MKLEDEVREVNEVKGRRKLEDEVKKIMELLKLKKFKVVLTVEFFHEIY